MLQYKCAREGLGGGGTSKFNPGQGGGGTAKTLDGGGGGGIII